jgi:hypothetical protein
VQTRFLHEKYIVEQPLTAFPISVQYCYEVGGYMKRTLLALTLTLLLSNSVLASSNLSDSPNVANALVTTGVAATSANASSENAAGSDPADKFAPAGNNLPENYQPVLNDALFTVVISLLF